MSDQQYKEVGPFMVPVKKPRWRIIVANRDSGEMREMAITDKWMAALNLAIKMRKTTPKSLSALFFADAFKGRKLIAKNYSEENEYE